MTDTRPDHEPASTDEPSSSTEIGELIVIETTPDAAATPRRRRPWLGWVIALGILIILAILAVVGWFAAENIARAQIVAEIQKSVGEGTGIDPKQVQVTLSDDPVLPQLIAGELGYVGIAADGVAFGPLTGDIDIVMAGVATGEGQPIDWIEITVETPTEAFISALSSSTNIAFESAKVTDDGQVELASKVDLGIFGETEFGITLDLAVADGGATLQVQSVRLGDLEYTAENLASAPVIGAAAEQLLQPVPVCIADQFPPGVVPTALAMTPETVTFILTASDLVLSEDLLSQRGTCQ